MLESNESRDGRVDSRRRVLQNVGPVDSGLSRTNTHAKSGPISRTGIDKEGSVVVTTTVNPDGSRTEVLATNGDSGSRRSIDRVLCASSESGTETVTVTVNPDGSRTEVSKSHPDPYAGFEKPACPSGMPSSAYEQMCAIKEREYRRSINEKRAEEIVAQLSNEGYDVVGVQSALNKKREVREPMAVMRVPDKTNSAGFGTETESISISSVSADGRTCESISNKSKQYTSRFDNAGLSNVARTSADNSIDYGG